MTHEGTQLVNFPAAKFIKTLSVYLSFIGILIRLRLSNNASRTTTTSGNKTLILFQKAIFAVLLSIKDYMNIILQVTIYLLQGGQFSTEWSQLPLWLYWI